MMQSLRRGSSCGTFVPTARSVFSTAPLLRTTPALLSGNNLSYRSISSDHKSTQIYGTTILCVKKGNQVVMIGDGQVSFGSTIMKPNARKVRQIRPGIIAGFAGATADAFTLFERLEEKIEKHQGQLLRSCVDLAKEWRTDKFLRRLEAMMVVADKDLALTLTGNGDVIEPNEGIIAIGSGGSFALACARGLIDIPDMDAEQIARKSMRVAADLCIYTNDHFVMEKIVSTDEDMALAKKDEKKGSILSTSDEEEKKQEEKKE
ncbi:ATP-dependent protease subunit HslV [Balamuthia mandrillaris]